ncbi:hypothetical protein BHE74_00014853 [Ensete ventricosum]|nr:hypothetical protein BHE74_00014853 [Ensete ventricosum]
MVTTTVEDAVNGDSDEGSYERWHRGKRKLLMCLVAAEEAADLSPTCPLTTEKDLDLSIDNERSCTRRQWRSLRGGLGERELRVY